MKTDRPTTDLEQLLDALERDGRDARRQQQLADMIDNLAANEKAAASRVRRMWTMRIAAAACVLFFIVTAARIWFIPTTQPAGPQMAQLEVPVAVADTTAPVQEALPVDAAPTVRPQARRKAVAVKPAEEVEAVPEEFVAEAVPQAVEPQPEALEPLDRDLDGTTLPAADPVEELAQPIVSVGAESEPLAQAEPAPEPEPRRSLLSGLFHRAKPSNMDGTMLAINLL